MYFTSGSDRAFEQLMQTRPGADHFDSGEAGAPEDCGTCRFYRPHWKYQFCVYEECPYQPGKLTALDGAVKFQVKGVDDEMAVFRVEKNRGYTVMSNHHLRNKDLSLKAKGLLSQMLSLPEDWDFTLKGLSLINREQIDAIRAAVKELEQAGYIVRSRERDSQGRLRGADYIIYEQPQPVPDSPTLENPTLDNPTQEKPMKDIYHSWEEHTFLNLLKKFSLPTDKPIKQFSKGMKMKLAIAVALSHNSKLLILDEATSGLDPVIRDDILDILLDFAQDETHSILISSHITTDLEKIADYIVFIHEGQVVFSKPKDELIEQYGIIKCGAAQFEALDKSDIIVYRKMDYEWQVLVADRAAMKKKYPKALIDSASIDEIMLLYVKGERGK